MSLDYHEVLKRDIGRKMVSDKLCPLIGLNPAYIKRHYYITSI